MLFGKRNRYRHVMVPDVPFRGRRVFVDRLNFFSLCFSINLVSG